MEERNYKLYVHISPSNKRYYGITCRKIERRWQNGTGYKGNEYFTRAINKYGWNNFHHIVLFDNLTKEEACLLEQMYIALYDTTNPKYGYNNSLGGEHGLHSEQTKNKMSKNNGRPWKGRTFPEEIKKKLSENNARYWKGKQFTEEHKKKMSEHMKGRQVTEETKKKLSEAMRGENNPNYGKHHSRETIKKMRENSTNAKPILMFSKNNEFIQRFNSIAEANEFLGKGRHNMNIHNCARGENKTAYGYKWIYEENYIKEHEQAI